MLTKFHSRSIKKHYINIQLLVKINAISGPLFERSLGTHVLDKIIYRCVVTLAWCHQIASIPDGAWDATRTQQLAMLPVHGDLSWRQATHEDVKAIQNFSALLLSCLRQRNSSKFRYVALRTTFIPVPFMSSFGLQLPPLGRHCQNVLLDGTLI